MSNLKLEVGKFYRDGNGNKIVIYAIHEQEEDPVHGAVLALHWRKFYHWYPFTWKENGDHPNDVVDSPFRIVSEWPDEDSTMDIHHGG